MARPAAHVEEIGRRSAVVLDEVHSRHRQAGAVDHATDRAFEVDEVDPEIARPGVYGVLLVEVPHRLKAGVAVQARVIQRDLCVKAHEALADLIVRAGFGHDGKWVDLDQVRVVGPHRGVEALSDCHEGIQQRVAQADRQTQAAGLECQEPELRICGHAVYRLGILASHLLDLDATLGRGHQHYSTAHTVHYRPEVVLLDDLRGCADQHLPDRYALDFHADDSGTDFCRFRRRTGEPHPTCLAASADEHLRLDDHAFGTDREEAFGRRPDLPGGSRHLPRRNRQSLRQQECLCVRFLDLQERQLLSLMGLGSEMSQSAAARAAIARIVANGAALPPEMGQRCVHCTAKRSSVGPKPTAPAVRGGLARPPGSRLVAPPMSQPLEFPPWSIA